MKSLILLGFFCLSAHAANTDTTCSIQTVPPGTPSTGMTCISHTDEQKCAGLAEVATQACQNYAKITYSHGTLQASCAADEKGSFVQYVCSDN